MKYHIEVLSKSQRDLVSKLKLLKDKNFYTYPYPLLQPLLDLKVVSVASLDDIAAMKVIAIIQRGTKRDFIDIYYLIKKMGLSRILKLSEQKYKDFNTYLALQALLYFEDAEKERFSIRKIRLKESVKWNEVKSHIIQEVKKAR